MPDFGLYDGHCNRATAWAYSGISLAIVGGVPLSTALGQACDWQAGFAIFGAFGVIIFIMGYFRLPSMNIAARVPGEASRAATGR